MPRYFIDTKDESHLYVDEEGHDLTDAEAARRLALTSLPEIVAERIGEDDRRTVSVRVRDEGGHVLYAAELVLAGEWRVPALG